jgi:heat-inducible transcription repressor hrcA
MELDDRKLEILKAVIKNYLETGEPVGSRTISKFSELKLSSATIRNEMSDLEDMGYLVKPHTSAGRIPSDNAYRLYVDSLMQTKIKEEESLKKDLIEKSDKLETLLQQVANLLAMNTNYTTVVSAPKYESNNIKFIQLSEIDEENLLIVVVLEKNAVKNTIIRLDEAVEKSLLLKLNIMLNSFLAGLNMKDINIGVIAKMKEQAGEYVNLVGRIIDAIGSVFSEDDSLRIYTSGTTNILKYPELNDSDNMQKLLYTIEEKKELSALLTDRMDDGNDDGIQVYIGNDTNVESLKDCSVVTATYEIEEGVYGKIGIVGPKRMDYAKVVGSLKNLMRQLDSIFKHQSEDKTTKAIKLIDMKNDVNYVSDT